MEFKDYIPWIISLAMLIISLVTLGRNGRKERKAEFVEEDSKIDAIKESLIKVNIKLDSLCATTNETRSDIKAMNEYMNSVEKRVSIVEQTLKTVWIRIDELKEQVKQHE